MELPKRKINFLNIRPTKSLSKVINETKAHFELIKKMSFSEEALSNEELDAFLRSSKKKLAATAILCGKIPQNKTGVQIALNAARKFFSREKEGIKAFKSFLLERVDDVYDGKSPGRLQSFLDEWRSARNGKIQKLSPCQLMSFANDILRFKGLGIASEASARILRSYYGISFSGSLSYLSRYKASKPLNKEDSSLKKHRNESSDEGQLRKICAYAIFLLAYMPKKKLISKNIAEAIFITATICANLQVWKTNRSLSWWIRAVERIFAGQTATTRRANRCSPHR